MRRLLDEIVRPAAVRFQPNLILVSAGFDAHWLDPLAMCQVTLSGYAHITQCLMDLAQELCGGKLAFVLEGGYHLAALTGGVTTVLRTLLGERNIPDALGPAPRPEPDLSDRLQAWRKLHHLA
jgi:acetoin utilization deacetylase AcuC-like enzyme